MLKLEKFESFAFCLKILGVNASFRESFFFLIVSCICELILMGSFGYCDTRRLIINMLFYNLFR